MLAPSTARTHTVFGTNGILASSSLSLRSEEQTAQQPPKGQAQANNGAGRPRGQPGRAVGCVLVLRPSDWHRRLPLSQRTQLFNEMWFYFPLRRPRGPRFSPS